MHTTNHACLDVKKTVPPSVPVVHGSTSSITSSVSLELQEVSSRSNMFASPGRSRRLLPMPPSDPPGIPRDMFVSTSGLGPCSPPVGAARASYRRLAVGC
jgi:hypothetical protein